MPADSAAPRRKLSSEAATLAAIGLSLLLALVCVGGTAAAGARRLQARPFILSTGDFALSAELTVDPGCAPLAEMCWPQRPRNRQRYFSVWLYRSSTQQQQWRLSSWRLLALPAGRERLPTPIPP